MSEWRKIWASGVPNESRSPNSGYRMAAKRVQPPLRWDCGMISTNVSGIWEMSVQEAVSQPDLTGEAKSARLVPEQVKREILARGIAR